MGVSSSIQEAHGHASAASIVAEAEAAIPAQGHAPEAFLSRSHGFLPVQPPLLALPPSHRVWDEAAAMLPELNSTQRIRDVLDRLPLLPANAASLDPGYLWRAGLMLGYLAHAHWNFSSTRVPLPSCIVVPWTEVNRRLGRAHPGLSMVDYCCYNWRLLDAAGARSVENMGLLVAWFNNEAERVFMAAATEMHARSGTLVDAAANLQDAVARHDVGAAKLELLRVTGFVHDITFKSLLKIDPNPYSRTFTDPLVWTKAWVVYTGTVNDHERGLGGSGTPIIELLDAMFERSVHATSVAHETLRLRDWMPSYPKRFIDSFRRTSIAKFIAEAGDGELAGIYDGALDAYAGKRSFLSVHRLKVYGFMELGFKAGRTETNSGFSGEEASRAWDELDDTLEATRRERHVGKPNHCPVATRTALVKAADSRTSPVSQVVLDIAGQGMRYIPGDRLGVFPQNSAGLVDRTLAALRATDEASVRLTSAWRDALAPILGEAPGAVPLRTFLAYAKLRPLGRPVGKALLRLSACRRLHELLEHRREDQVELWDALEMLADDNYDVRRLWKAAPWEVENIARIVPPESFRIYSISSMPESRDGEYCPRELHLTVGRLSFESQPAAGRPAMAREGTASGYLVRGEATADRPPRIPVRVFRPGHFQLPEDPATPIVMFAGGTGISPFRGFLQARAADRRSGPAWLFVGTRTFSDLPYMGELRGWVAGGHLELRVAFSREPKRLRNERGDFVAVPGPSGYVDALLEDEADSAAIWRLLNSRDNGGAEGCFYICGQASFAHTVIKGLKRVIAQHLPDTGGDRGAATEQLFRRLVAHGRLMQDVFTTFAPSDARTAERFERFDASEVVEHNNAERGYWIIIRGNVYDMTEFMYLHPGGERLLVSTAGMDGTASYEKAEHHLDSGVHALLDLYKIGSIRRLDFRDVWDIAVEPNGDPPLLCLDLHELYRRWIRALYRVVELENSLHNNLSLRHRALVEAEAPETMSKLKARVLLESHDVFYRGGFREVLGVRLQTLWNGALGICDHATRITKLPDAITAALSSEQARRAEARTAAMWPRLKELSAHPADDPAGWSQFERDLESIGQADLGFVAGMKAALRDGLVAFEQHEHRLPELGRDALIGALEHVPPFVERYYSELLRDEA
jgi:sulfite reductase alpha subunit-like flavoprotein